MFSNYLKIIFRNLWRSKGFSFINLFGLACGMSVCLLILIFVHYERGYDQSYKRNIYRLCARQQKNANTPPEKVAQTLYPIGTALKTEIPGIKDYTRIIAWGKVPLQIQGKTAVVGTLFGTDASFMRLFGFNLMSGNTATALEEPNSMVITQRMARNLFGNNDPMGQTVRHEGRDTMNFTVTGILHDLPLQSHLQFDALYSLSTVERPDWSNNWETEWTFTYVELEPNTDVKALQAQFPGVLQKHLQPGKQPGYQLFLQSVKDIHLYSADITRDLLNTQPFDGNYIPLLTAVAFFVLLLGIINYINIHTARLFTRAKEVGIRKTSGAGYREIVIRFLAETAIYTMLAFIGALLIIVAALPLLGRLTQRTFSLAVLEDPYWILYSAGVILGTCLLAGLVPAVTMARIRPVAVLKGKLWTSHRSSLRSTLVVVQFTIAIGLSLAALAAYRQFRFIQQYDLGFNKEGVVVIPVSDTDRRVEEQLMERLRNIPGVQDVTGALRRLGNTLEQHEVIFQGGNEKRTFRCANMYVDYNYLSFYHIDLLAGRDFSPAFGTDRTGNTYIINETMARLLLSYSSASDTSLAGLIGQPFGYGYFDTLGTVVGIARDFNFSSLHLRIEPLSMSYQHEYYFTDLSIKLDMTKTKEALSQIERVWKTTLPTQPFAWHFLDNHLEQLYRSDQQAGTLMIIFSVIALVVSCLGLIGVAAFIMERRAKEVSIRKVMGATVSHIVFLLSKDFLRLVFISICIALPIAWWAVHQWMQEFAYHTAIGWELFAITGLLSFLLAAVTIIFQVGKAAMENPVKQLGDS